MTAHYDYKMVKRRPNGSEWQPIDERLKHILTILHGMDGNSIKQQSIGAAVLICFCAVHGNTVLTLPVYSSTAISMQKKC